MNKPLPSQKIPIQIFNAIIVFLRQNYTLDISALLVKVGLDETLLEDKHAFVNVAFLASFIDEIIAQTKDVEFLFKLGTASKPYSLGILGYMMLHSKSLYDALVKLCKYHRLLGNRFHPTLQHVGEYTYLRLLGESSLSDVMFETSMAEVHFCALLSIINQIASQKIIPSKTLFRHAKPKYIERYHTYFGTEISFDQPENILVFETSSLHIKTLYDNEALLAFFEKEANKYLDLPPKEGLSEKVSRQIILCIEELDFSLQSVAKRLSLHPRNLQKQLKNEGESFASLLMEVRKKLALQYLRDGMEITMIATLLGYGELSSFSRAFKQWYQCSPAHWLEQHTHKA